MPGFLAGLGAKAAQLGSKVAAGGRQTLKLAKENPKTLLGTAAVTAGSGYLMFGMNPKKPGVAETSSATDDGKSTSPTGVLRSQAEQQSLFLGVSSLLFCMCCCCCVLLLLMMQAGSSRVD